MDNARSHMVLEIPLEKSLWGKKSISFIGPSIWNKLSNNLNVLNTTASSYPELQKTKFSKFNLNHNFSSL